MAEQPLPPPPVMPDAGTSEAEFDETLGRAIDAGRIDPALADADPKLAGAFAAHQKLESLFALIRGPAQPDGFCRERPLWRSADPQPTQLGRYQVKSTLGVGAFGTVYLARDPELNREVAIKVSRAGTFTSADALDKFRAEARRAASLNHPQIVAVHDVGREGDRLYIVMHYIPGRTLAADGREGSTKLRPGGTMADAKAVPSRSATAAANATQGKGTDGSKI
ncbi:MAG: protein kinase domain-containing protein [Pirellulales bacterium]